MHWLSNPRVRLGLLVNGLYLLSLFIPTQQPTQARRYSYPYEERAERRLRSPFTVPAYAPLPTLKVPLKAESHYWKESDQLDIYLTRELILVRQQGHTLLLSPTFTTRTLVPEQPRSVLLYFTSFSHEQFYDKDSPFVVMADGTALWRYGWRAPGDETPSNRKAMHSAALDGDGQVVETLGHEIPYDIFARITRAKHVTIELGPDRVELTPEQLEALRDMNRRLPQIPPAQSGRDYVPYSNSKMNY